MKKVVSFLVFLSTIQCQDIFVDGVAAVVENKIVLKSDLNQTVNMMALLSREYSTFPIETISSVSPLNG